MIARLVRTALAATLVLACSTGSARSQEFRVSTRLSVPGARNAAGSRSTALFHAGKVYDSVDDGVHSSDEMTLFEPAHHRVVLMDSRRRVTTTIPFDFIEQAVHEAERRTAARLTDLGSSRRDAGLAETLRFQLQPEFSANLNVDRLELSLKSAVLSYTVKCDRQTESESIAAYLNYADWAVRLNLLEARTSMLPAARLRLNQELRQRKLLPIEVTLQTHKPAQRKIKAEHQFYWDLAEPDRKSIHHWESLLRSGVLREVSFDEYHKDLLKQTAAR